MFRAALLAVIAWIGLASAGFAAGTPTTRSGLETQNNLSITTGKPGNITGASLNSLLGNMISSTITPLDYSAITITEASPSNNANLTLSRNYTGSALPSVIVGALNILGSASATDSLFENGVLVQITNNSQVNGPNNVAGDFNMFKTE